MRRFGFVVSLTVVISTTGTIVCAAPEEDFAGSGPRTWSAFGRVDVPPEPVVAMEAPPREVLPPANVSGRWVGTWTGGAADFRRTGTVVAEFDQDGATGSGMLVMHDAIAADDVPITARMAGSAGVGVAVEIVGSAVIVRHELGGSYFTAGFVVDGDRMVGRVERAATPVRLVLTRLPGTQVAATSAATPPAKDVDLRAEMAELRLLAFRALNTAEGASSVADRASSAADTSTVTTRELLAKIDDSGDRATPVRAAPVRRDVVATTTVNFKFNRWDLNDAAQTALLDVIDELREHPDLMVNLEGYADPVGSHAYNIGLSERRAAAVVRYLVVKGVELSRIHWAGLGILDGTGTPEEQAKKRRVTIKLTAATFEAHP